MSLRSADVAIVGGGLAGMAAAVRCAEFGLHPLVLEAGEDSRYLCNSRIAMGFFNVAMQDIARGPAALREAIEIATRGHADPVLADVLACQAGPALSWLRQQGVRFMVGGPHQANRALLTPPAALRPGLHWAGRGGDVMLRRLEANLLSRGGAVLRGVRAVELLMDRRRCAGLVVVEAGRRVTVCAEAVILADGGFQANPELLRLYITPRPDRVLQRNAGTARGDGLLMAQGIGAMLTPMDRFYGHVQSRDAMTNRALWPYPTVDFPITAGIAVNRHGRRFARDGPGARNGGGDFRVGGGGFFQGRSLGVRTLGQGFCAKGHLVGAGGHLFGALDDSDHGGVQFAHRLVEVHPQALVFLREELIDIDVEIALRHGAQTLGQTADHLFLRCGGLGEDLGLGGQVSLFLGVAFILGRQLFGEGGLGLGLLQRDDQADHFADFILAAGGGGIELDSA